MAGSSWEGRSGVTRERALQRAVVVDNNTQKETEERLFPPPRELFSEIRAYLVCRSEEMHTSNNPYDLLKLRPSNSRALIVMGPEFDKGPTPQHFHFDSGARLSFGLTLRERDRGAQLVSFRYHYQLPAAQSPEYIRFDLNEAQHEDPLSEPRCHLHPGLEDVRLPISLHDPFEILDRIFFVLEENIQRGQTT
jgi:hypothetical protein